eukprot:scaffold132120_cov86-Attheya_sp.AAC.1
MTEQSNVLQQMLLKRLTSHENRRHVTNHAGQDIWPFLLTAENMARCVSIISLQGHRKNDLSCLGEEKTLLANANSFMLATSDAARNLEGAYLYFDSNDGIHVRSGKVSGRSFADRHKEHKVKAAGGIESLFYRRYPSKELICTAETQGRKGCFENLSQLVAVSIDPKNPSVDEWLDKIFVFSDEHMKRLEPLRFGDRENRTMFRQVPGSRAV